MRVSTALVMAGIAAAAFAGCGSEAELELPERGPSAFLADAREAGIDAADKRALDMGYTGCDLIGSTDMGADANRVGFVVALLQEGNGITEGQASDVVRSAVQNLCPEHAQYMGEQR